ncbi:hypothetical protein ASE26_15380 [Duganella sp. Root198D2]|nr:hypothetical protein ASD07_16335 [Duganella sp. Root336D2]KRB81716.1 hypothetical protein ASE26_15380 [Duganella sp. Root198D2]
MLTSLLALWLFTHPWRGIWHDGMLYAVQAMRRLYPANFQGDLFFLHGSQDAFTLFSPLYAAAIAEFGLQPATFTLQLGGYLLWIGAASFLAVAVLRGFYLWLGLAMLFAWPADYGPSPDVFHLAESLLTPRLFAEGLGILALGCFVRQRWGWGLLPACLALALHPLIACAPLLAGALLFAWGSWRALAAALLAGLALTAALVGAGVPPFGRLLLGMDAEWLALVNSRAPMMAWTAWQAQDWVSRTGLAFCLVLTAGWLAEGMTARLFRCAAALGALGLLASWAGTGLASNLLLLQAQPWRLLWMTHLCSWLALAWLLAAYWRRERLVRVLLLALCLAALTRDTVGGGVALLAGAMLCCFAPRPPLRWPAWGNAAALLGLAAMILAWGWQVTFLALKTAAVEPAPQPGWLVLLWASAAFKLGAGALLGTGLLLLIRRCSGSRRKAPQLLAFGLAFSMLCLSVLYAAIPVHRQHELSASGARAVQSAFAPLIAQDAVLYWQNNVMVSWFLLHRSNYASNAQITGLAFNRGTAVEGMRRMERLRQLGGEDAVVALDILQTRLGALQLPPPSRAGLQFACADPVLDYVVLATPLGVAAIAQASDSEYGKTYYLYDCARLRGH